MSKKNPYSLAATLKRGIITENPTLVQTLGMCPSLAISTSVINGLGMGLSVTVILICSNVIISLLRKLIPDRIRIAAYITIIAGFVMAIEMLLKAYLPDISASLGIFIPLIVVNCIILARAEAFASKNTVYRSFKDGLATGLGFTFALVIISAIRELLGSGKLLGFPVLGASYPDATLFLMAPGAFLVLGFVVAVFRKLNTKKEGK
ncbi:MAG: electron transport complex subunit E [Clostridia bacterium]|nr:electron transport complex subunit E [Clostridia bacterium]